MSDTEVKSENKSVTENNEEVDIYADVLSDQDSLIEKLKGKVNKLSKEKELLLKSLNSIQNNYEQLRKDYGELEDKYKVVSFNSSALFKTAQAEIKRKDKVINELRKEKDDLVFRKVSVNQALQRARRSSVLSPKKYRSPIKKQNLDRSIAPLESLRTTKGHSEELKRLRPAKGHSEELKRLRPAKGPAEELESPKPTQRPSEELQNPKQTYGPLEDLESPRQIKGLVEDVESSRPTKRLLEGNGSNANVSSCQVDEETKATVEVLDQISDTPKNDNLSNKTKPTPPPLNGPLTAYSKRLYKRIHGVSPQKIGIGHVKRNSQCSNDESPEKTEPNLKISTEEKETNTRTQHDHKTVSIASKLQKEVKEIIKLGSSSKTSPPCTTKHSPDISKLLISPKDENPKQYSSNSLGEKLIIQCDLRNTSKERFKKSPNSVSIHETIDNILKKQRAGLYSPHPNVINNTKEEETKQDRDSTCKTGSRLLTNLNRRTADKLTISPATFGKLVSHSAKSRSDVTPPSKTAHDIMEEKTGSKKRKLSESFSSSNNISPQQHQRPRQETYPETIRKNMFITSLFGESPMKSDIANTNIDQPSPCNRPVGLRTPPIERVLNSSSPIFPDSPSLDSDNPEDLIIDTTACSQSTSPRVSESDKKELNEIALVKVPFPLNNKSESKLPSQCVEIKESVTEADTNSDFTAEKNNSATVKTTNKDQTNNSSVINKIIDNNQDKKESTISAPQIVICEKSITQDSNEHKAGRDNVRNVDMETSHSSASLDKILSPEKSSKSQTSLKENTKEETLVTRFIPSPPQLTLVSAFKHSENSVFALAEDTLGFVSALTRMRDISPIRTPDKKSKLSNKTLSQTRQSKLIEPECPSRKESEILKNNNFEFLKPLSQGFQNNSSSLTVVNKIDSLASKSKLVSHQPAEILNTGLNCSLNLSGKAEKEDEDFKKNDLMKTNTSESTQPSDNPSWKASNSNQEDGIKKASETSKVTKVNKDIADMNSRKPQILKHNPFRRTKPVRRISIENKIIPEAPASSNISVKLTNSHKKYQHSSKAQANHGIESSKEMDMIDNHNKSVEELVTDVKTLDKSVNNNVVKTRDSGTVKKDSDNEILAEKIPNSDKESVQSDFNGSNKCPTKVGALPSLVPSNIDKIQTFKRSESLKMMQKPLPMNYLNVMGNRVTKNSEDMYLEVSNNKTRSSGEHTFEESKPNTKSKLNKETDKSSELEQISHIGNINKKLRVSKCQNKPEKENVNQLKLSETVAISEKKPKDISGEKVKTKTSLVKDNDGVISETVRENKIYKQHSTSLNVSHRAKRRNDRRSVSLGPEIRLGIHINLPPLHRNKQIITASRNCSKDSKSLKPVDKISDNKVLTKSCCNEINENMSRKSKENAGIERPNEEIVLLKGNKISASNNLALERKMSYHARRSRSLSPRRQRNRNIKSKSPDVEEISLVSRRSPSRSPECNKRSKSSYKVSPRKSPDLEGRNCLNLRRSDSRSPERRGKSRYSPTRIDNGGRSRRRSRYDKYRRRSPSSNYKRLRYHEMEHRSRSSHYKHRHRSDRSRSISPEPKHRKFDERHRSRNHLRSISSSLSHERSSRNCSPSILKSDCLLAKNVGSFSRKHSSNVIENISSLKSKDNKLVEENQDDDTILSYKEELEKMKREIEMLKGKVNKNEKNVPEDFSSQQNNCEEHSLQRPSEGRRSFEVSINKSVDSVETVMCFQSEKINGNIRTESEEVVLNKTNSLEPLQRSRSAPSKETGIENTQSLNKPCNVAVQPTILSQENPKPIQIKRRVRKLGDSEVQVVSIK